MLSNHLARVVSVRLLGYKDIFFPFLLEICLVKPSFCYPIALVSIDEPYLSQFLALFVSKWKPEDINIENCSLYIGSLWKTGGDRSVGKESS